MNNRIPSFSQRHAPHRTARPRHTALHRAPHHFAPLHGTTRHHFPAEPGITPLHSEEELVEFLEAARGVLDELEEEGSA